MVWREGGCGGMGILITEARLFSQKHGIKKNISFFFLLLFFCSLPPCRFWLPIPRSQVTAADRVQKPWMCTEVREALVVQTKQETRNRQKRQVFITDLRPPFPSHLDDRQPISACL